MSRARASRCRACQRVLTAYAPAMIESGDVETVERVIPQPPEAIFAFLADPAEDIYTATDGEPLRDAV